MDVRNCKNCGKLFNYITGPPFCPSCMKVLDEKFVDVKRYIYDHPGAGMQEVSEENDVSTSQIKKWIREERLSFAEDSCIGLECESCGKIIKTGRFCQQCKDHMSNSLKNAYSEPKKEPVKKTEQKTNAKMRFLDNE